jgi:hypothetical protein
MPDPIALKLFDHVILVPGREKPSQELPRVAKLQGSTFPGERDQITERSRS